MNWQQTILSKNIDLSFKKPSIILFIQEKILGELHELRKVGSSLLFEIIRIDWDFLKLGFVNYMLIWWYSKWVNKSAM